LIRSVKQLLLLVAISVATGVGCGSKVEEGSIDPGEIKTAPAGKTNNRPPIGGAEPQKASGVGGSAQSAG